MGKLSSVSDREEPATRSAIWDESRLIARIRGRDMAAFEMLYRSMHLRLSRFVANIVHRPQLVEEVFNDTMLVVWEKIDSFAGESKLSTWIFAIAYRKAMRALRRLDEAVEDPGVESRVSHEPSPDHNLGQQRVHEALIAAIGQLSPDHRAVVDLTYFQELSYREIAEIMDCPADTVKTRMFHARRHLKRRLAGEREDWL